MTMKRRLFLQASVGAAALWPARMLLADGVAPLADLSAKSLTGGDLTLRGVDIRDLAAGMRGQVLVGGQAGYEEARRVWNGMFDKHPAVIARCASPSDVMRAVTFARENGLLTAVRCGGHSLSGKSVCDGGIVIDLSPMQGVRVDADARIARVEGGALLRHLDRETRAFGLVTTAGTQSLKAVEGDHKQCAAPFVGLRHYVYFASDVVAQTSDNEGTPVALIEAQAAGVPVVTTAVGGVASAVLDGETGRITTLGEDAAMAAAISGYLGDALRRREHGERGRAHVRASFALDGLVAEIDGLYRGLLSSDRSRARYSRAQ